MALTLRTPSLNLSFNLGGVAMDVSDAEARAAWALSLELATRVAAHPLEPGAGSAREALDSVYTLVGTTREVLREAGADVAQSRDSLGPLAIRLLNEGLRPFVVRWHTAIGRSEELADERRAEFDADLERIRGELEQDVDALGEIAGIKD